MAKKHKPAPKLNTRMRAARNRLGWSQTELARRVGVSLQWISLIERGEREPGAATRRAIADTLRAG